MRKSIRSVMCMLLCIMLVLSGTFTMTVSASVDDSSEFITTSEDVPSDNYDEENQDKDNQDKEITIEEASDADTSQEDERLSEEEITLEDEELSEEEITLEGEELPEEDVVDEDEAEFLYPEKKPVSGTCGENLTWKFDGDKTLTISGTGKMDDYVITRTIYTTAPWDSYAVYIRKVIIENGVTSIGDLAFHTHSLATEFELADTIESIGEEAFGKMEFDSHYSLTLPKNLRLIKKNAFCDAIRLASIRFTGDIPTIEENAFRNCYVLAYYPSDNKTYTESKRKALSNRFLGVVWVGDKEECVSSGKAGENITWKYTKTQEGGTLAFSGSGEMYNYSASKTAPWFVCCDPRTTVTFSSGITRIGNYSFYKNQYILKVTFPNTLTEIGEHAFDGAYVGGKLPKSLKKICDYAFYANGLSSYSIVAGEEDFLRSVTYIGDYALAGSYISKFIDLSNCEHIGEGAFYRAAIQKTDLALCPKLSYLGAKAFANNQLLTGKLVLPDSVKALNDSIISGTKITELVCGSKITGIGRYAIEGTIGNLTVTFKSDYPEGVSPDFLYMDRLSSFKNTIKYPFDSKNWYDKIKDLYPFSQHMPGTNAKLVEFAPYGKATVTFVDPYGNTVKTQQVGPGEKIAAPSVSLKDGDEITGWYTGQNPEKNDNAEKWNFDNAVCKPMTLYAYTKKVNYYKVRFVTPFPDQISIPVMRVKAGEQLERPDDPVVRDYTFGGWYTDKMFTDSSRVFSPQVNSDLTLYGKFDHWIRIHYWYGSVGGSRTILNAEPGSKIYYEPEVGPESWQIHAPDNYEFAGWYYDKEFKKPVGKDDEAHYETKVYARWKIDGVLETPGKQPDPTPVPEPSDDDDYSPNIKIGGITDKEYCASPVVQEKLTVTDGDRKLKEGTDYTVKYANNIKVGKAKLTITFKGNYSGSVTKEFEIKPFDLNKAYKNNQVIFSQNPIVLPYNKKVQKGKTGITVTVGAKKITLKEKSDFTFEYPDLKENTKAYRNVGSYGVVISGKGNYKGSLNITEKIIEAKPVSKLTVTGLVKSTPYTGKAITPDFVIKDGKKVVENSLFKIVYSDNKNVGTATVKITAKDGSGYFGELTKTFKITGKDITSGAAVLSIKKIEFNGKAIEFDGDSLKVYADKKKTTELKKDRDYKVSYENNVNAGTAKVHIVGINGYCGEVVKSFKITPYEPMAGMSLNAKSFTVEYDKNGAVLDWVSIIVKMKDGSKITLQPGEYAVTYTENKNAGTAWYKISFKGNFTGTNVGSYNVTSKSLSKLTDIRVSDVVYKKAAGNYKTSVSLYDNGKKLECGVDYEKSFEYKDHTGKVLGSSDKIDLSSVNARTLSVTIKGKGNYSGSVTKTYRIAKADISKAAITVKPQYYVPGNLAIPKDSDITIKVGGKALKKDVDYKVTFTENNKAGTGKAEFVGIGKYCGKKTVTYKIKAARVKK